MADETQKTRVQRGKITLAALGNPSLIKTMSPEQKAQNKGRYFVGTIFGRAIDFVERTDEKKAEKYEGLTGNFMSVPSDTNNFEEIESGVLFIPDAFHNIIAGQLRQAKKDNPGAAIEFASEFYSIEAKNAAGYSWEMLPAVPFVGKHPLADIMSQAKLTAEKRKAIAAPARK